MWARITAAWGAAWGWLSARRRLAVGVLIAGLLLLVVALSGPRVARYVNGVRADLRAVSQAVTNAQQARDDAATAAEQASASAEVARTEAVTSLRAADAASGSAAAASASAQAAAQPAAGTTTIAQATTSTPATAASGSAPTTATASASSAPVATKPTAPIGKVVAKTAKPTVGHPLTLAEAQGLVDKTLARLHAEQGVSTRPVRKHRSVTTVRRTAAAPHHLDPAAQEYADGL